MAPSTPLPAALVNGWLKPAAVAGVLALALLNPGVQVQVFKKSLDLPLLWQLIGL